MLEIKISPSGTLSLDHNNDIETSSNSQALAEHIMIRLLTKKNSATYMPGIGSDLYLITNYPNTRETGLLIESVVIDALTRDNFFDVSELDITAVPTADNEVSIFIDLNTYPRQQFVYTYDLTSGSVIKP